MEALNILNIIYFKDFSSHSLNKTRTRLKIQPPSALRIIQNIFSLSDNITCQALKKKSNKIHPVNPHLV